MESLDPLDKRMAQEGDGYKKHLTLSRVARLIK